MRTILNGIGIIVISFAIALLTGVGDHLLLLIPMGSYMIYSGIKYGDAEFFNRP